MPFLKQSHNIHIPSSIILHKDGGSFWKRHADKEKKYIKKCIILYLYIFNIAMM